MGSGTVALPLVHELEDRQAVALPLHFVEFRDQQATLLLGVHRVFIK